jgi:IclR family transcriptional regulator, pca regulon regulatory protein
MTVGIDVVKPGVKTRRGAGSLRGGSRPKGLKLRVLPKPEPRLSRSLEYGVALLECYSSERRDLGIADLADLVGISRSTMHRYAITLVELGFLEQNNKHKYRLSRHAADAGGAAIGALRRQLPARSVLEQLRGDVGHTVSMGVLDCARVIYVYRLLGHRLGQYAIDTGLGLGVSAPVSCTALGKVLLASLSDAEQRELLAGLKLRRYTRHTIVNRRKFADELDRVSPRGVVVSDEEFRVGSRSIAVLVPRLRGERPLAIDVTVPSSAYTVDRLVKEIGPKLKRAATQISESDVGSPQ